MTKPHIALPQLTVKQIARFWHKVRKGAPDACWPWTRCCNTDGHGRVRIERRAYQAHRIAYVLGRGAFPQDLCVMHICDNPPCCNPRHLRIGTHRDNNADMKRKGRGASGEAHGMAKLAAEDVASIRRRHGAGGVGQHMLAAEYGVSRATINLIVRRNRWRRLA